MNQAQEAFEIVKGVGLSVRSSAIAQRLDCTAANVHELLLPYVQRGDLIACDVEARGEQLKDYRLSVSGGGKAPMVIYKGRPPAQPKVTIFGMGKDETPPAPARAARPSKKQEQPAPPAPERQQPKETGQMTTADKCEAAFRKHGPMTTRELREHVKAPYVSTITAQYARTGRFAVLGGGTNNKIYGLPDQHASAPKADKPPRSIHRKPAKAAGGGGRVLKKQRAGAFRPSITCDGEILLTGAASAGELNAAEVRVLADFMLRMSAGIGA